MDNNTPKKSDTSAPVVQSTTSSLHISSPTTSVFSRGHASRSSGSVSSVASSPLPRDSFALYTTSKRLEDVTEEPQERDDLDGYTLVDQSHEFSDNEDNDPSHEKFQYSTPSSPTPAEYSLGDHDSWSTTSSRNQHSKRQRSIDQSTSRVAHRLTNRIESISRRWKTRSGVGPQLSIVTHTTLPNSRSSSTSSSRIISPALSAISKHENNLPPSPLHTSFDEALRNLDIVTSSTRDEASVQEDEDEERETAPVTTPLLPPAFTDLMNYGPIHSPLQSPSIAPKTNMTTGRASLDRPPNSSLPSPPLSSKTSVISMHQRSRANTATASHFSDIPPLQLLDDAFDPWSVKLGHANFDVQPEPYAPEQIDLNSYIEFRAHWDQARTNYIKHLARTAEHYGPTSKVYKLTEEKWTTIDDTWKHHNAAMTTVLSPVMTNVNGGDKNAPESIDSSAILEKPVTRMVLPTIDDKSGKFPELGDGEIVGPMTVVPPRTGARKNQSSEPISPLGSPRKRNLLRFLSDVFGRNHVSQH